MDVSYIPYLIYMYFLMDIQKDSYRLSWIWFNIKANNKTDKKTQYQDSELKYISGNNQWTPWPLSRYNFYTVL